MMIGTSIDRYRILEELGHGGMSVVYRGLDASLEREVAVKLLHQHLARKLENRKRFQREAKAIARLRHPNILEIYDVSNEDAERSYIVMEYVEGLNLRQFLARHGPPPPEIAALIGVEISNALAHAHDHGVIHRDLKPENVMVSQAGVVKLMDFGIAHVIDAETMTQTGSLLGSPAHMAPEMIEGERVDARADVFALGTVLYWLATGKLPFDGANAPQVLRRVLEGSYDDPELVDARIGSNFGDIVRRCLAHDPSARYPTVIEARDDLIAFAAATDIADDVSLELKRYFTDPSRYVDQFETSVVSRLSPLARRAHRQRDVPRAVAYYNRILAYDPDNTEVKQYLNSLCRRQRLSRWGALGAVILLVGAAGAFAAHSLMDEEESSVATPSEPVDPAVSGAAVAEAVERSQDELQAMLEDGRQNGAASAAHVVAFARRLSRAEAEDAAEDAQDDRPRVTVTPLQTTTPLLAVAPAEDDRKPDAGEPAEPATHVYRFSVIPPAANFFIDGRPVDVLQASTGVALSEGVHQLSAQSRGARPWSRTIEVTGPQRDRMPVVLEWEPGRVQIISNTRAVVWVGDENRFRPIGEHGKNATFTFPFGPADSTESEKVVTLRIASASDMGNPQVQRVRVKPGQLSTVNVNFKPIN